MSRMDKVSADIVGGEGSISQAESCLREQSKRTENSFSKKMITPQEQPGEVLQEILSHGMGCRVGFMEEVGF